MESFAPLLAYVAALAIAAVIPGPGIAALVGQSFGGGLRAALCMMAGIALGDLVYLTVAIAGLAAIAQTFAGAFLIIKALGGLYLIYLGYKFWTSEAGLTRVEATNGKGGFKAFLAGFAVTLGNPKTIVFYLALTPTVMDLKSIGLTDWLMLCALTVLVLTAILTPYAVAASKARQMMTRSETLLRINRYAASVIGGAGMLILGQAANALVRRA
ncbi:MAG: LysE family translocator [Rhodobacteraceae bacterium]|nr:LysE family translocator [Paracoccaceae bacterium]